MKKYMAPEMEMMDFIIDKNIAGVLGSLLGEDNIYNNDEFPSW